MRLLLDVLSTVEFVAGGPPELAAELVSLGRMRTLPRDHVFWRAGRPPEVVVVPVTGELAALGRDSGGRGICYGFFGVGECVGVPAAVDGMVEPREVRVIRGGEFFVVDRAAFLRFLDLHPAARTRVTEFLGRIFRRSLDERDRDVFLPVHARVARFLVERACVRRGDDARILLRESQPEIAIRLGSVREVIAREMSAFAEEGLVRRTRHALFVVDWAGLRAKAECGRGAGEDVCEEDSAALRTRRFFLPTLDGGAERVVEETQVCAEHLPDFRDCVARGCPLALAGESCRSAGRTATPHAPRAAAEDPSRERVHDETLSRTPQEEHEIRRRVATYRRRVAGIESRFGDEGHVPAEATLFGDSQGA